MNKRRYLEETGMLDFSSPEITSLVDRRQWRTLPPCDRVKAIYCFVRDEILFGYNSDDSLPASRVLSDGYGQCNTKATLFMAILRACGIECRLHGFAIAKRLQKGAMPALVYRLSPKSIIHSWVEVYLSGVWYELEAVILDKAYLEKLQKKFSFVSGQFIGYGVAVSDLQHPVIDFDLNNTYIQSEGIIADYGVYDSPDELLSVHHQGMSFVKGLMYRSLGRHLMNASVRRIRNS